MRVFVYEFVTGGGWHCADSQPAPLSLVREGGAMLTALAADFAAIDGVHVDMMRDDRMAGFDVPGCAVHDIGSGDEELATLAALAAAADWSVIIAPEFDGHLLARCRAVEQAGGRLLGPNPAIVALTADKHATAENLNSRGVPAPPGVALVPGALLPVDFAYPAVLKPRDGAGSQGIELVYSAQDTRVDRQVRLESYCRGTPASVACLCGSGVIVPLLPCEQRLSDDGRFAYLGGSLPLEPALAARATRLATSAIGTLDSPRGYLGVDLVLGRDPSGADDVAIEINPRLTTSYVGLRALAGQNLAWAMLSIARGSAVELSWHPGPIQFAAAGMISDSILGVAG